MTQQNIFTIRCVLSLTVGVACGLAMDPLWLALLVGVGSSVATSWLCDQEYQRGWSEHADRVDDILVAHKIIPPKS